MFISPKVWCGSEESLHYVRDVPQMLAALQANPEAFKAKCLEAKATMNNDMFTMPSLLTKHDSTGIIDISGPMVQGNAGFMRLFGITGYGDIKDALAEAATDPTVKTVMLAIDSPGGNAAGVQEAADAVQALDKTKPVVAFSSGTMASAAYWIGASARKVVGTNMSNNGSVGTVINHTEQSKARATAGLTDTTFRSGPYKALGNGREPLSDLAKAELQGLVNDANDIFVSYVAPLRGVTPAKFDATMGQGREFLGQKGVDVGLIDKVMTGEEALAFTKSLDKTNTGTQNSRNSQKGGNMKALSAKLILALIAGASMSDINLSTVEATSDASVPTADEQKELLAQATQIKAGVDAATAAATKAAVAPVQAKYEAAAAELVAATGKVTTLEAATGGLTTQLTEKQGMLDTAVTIVRASAGVMANNLGGTPDSVKDLDATKLLAEHARLSVDFAKKYKTGGVAAVAGAAALVPEEVAGPNPLFTGLAKSF